ncbi:MAG: adenylate/guanylate cyclase domain-containing protein [Hyphomicrobiaceae bacterium]
MAAVTRRLAAIVAMDVAGYSRLMAADEEATVAALRSHRTSVIDPAIDTYNGRVANTAGDSLLVEFSSAVDALRFAQDVQLAIANRNRNIEPARRLNFRIGINIGDVVVEGNDLLGDGVNVAARIEALAEPGGIAISRAVRDQVRDRLDLHLADLGDVEVKNIARPVRVFNVVQDKRAVAAVTAKKLRKQQLRVGMLAAALVATGFGASTWWGLGQPDFAVAPAPGTSAAQNSGSKVAVLPFENLSGDERQVYFVAGISEDISSVLSNTPGVSVISRSVVNRLFSKEADIISVAAKSGIGHVLAGTVRRSGGKVRVTANLIDTATGNQVWSERFDAAEEDIFSIQDSISQKVLVALERAVGGGTPALKARTYTPKLEAYDAYVRGRAERIPPTPANLAAALASFSRAIELDPQFAGGYAGASFVLMLMAFDSVAGQTDTEARVARALEFAETAVKLDPNFGPAWDSLAEVKYRTGDFDAALAASRRAVELAPGDTLMRGHFGRVLAYAGQPVEGLEQVRQAMRMDPDSLPMLYFLGLNYRSAGSYEQAIDTLLQHRRKLGGLIVPAPTTQLIVAYVEAGHLEEAQSLAQELLKASPGFEAEHARRIHPYRKPSDQDAFVAALRSAGLP